MDKGWIQFLFVAVPVLSLIGAWLTLRARIGRGPEHKTKDKVDER
ncbi:hypothetical protein [Parazoarcus communis]|nr:hypothetical protein [Parazoarcus communis]